MKPRTPGRGEDRTSEKAARDTQRRKYRAQVEKLEQQADKLALSYYKDHWETATDIQRERAMETLNTLFQRIELLAKLHGGTVERMDEYPDGLPAPEKGHANLRSNIKERYPWVKEGDQMFARMDVKGRSYVFFLPESGSVNVYQGEEYKGGNHDLALFEIDSHLEEGGWFGVNAP